MNANQACAVLLAHALFLVPTGLAGTLGGEQDSHKIESLGAFVEETTLEGFRVKYRNSPWRKDNRDRERRGAWLRFADGDSSVSLTYFDEEWLDDERPENRFEGYGLGVQIADVQILGGLEDSVQITLPHRVDIHGVKTKPVSGNPLSSKLWYTDVLAEIGVGLSWKGWRPTLGVSFEYLHGWGSPDETPIEVAAPKIRTLTTSPFIELEYRKPGSALSGRFRLQGGEQEGIAFGLGVKI